MMTKNYAIVKCDLFFGTCTSYIVFSLPHFYKGLSVLFWEKGTCAFVTKSCHHMLSSPCPLILCMRSFHSISLLEDVPLEAQSLSV